MSTLVSAGPSYSTANPVAPAGPSQPNFCSFLSHRNQLTLLLARQIRLMLLLAQHTFAASAGLTYSFAASAGPTHSFAASAGPTHSSAALVGPTHPTHAPVGPTYSSATPVGPHICLLLLLDQQRHQSLLLAIQPIQPFAFRLQPARRIQLLLANTPLRLPTIRPQGSPHATLSGA
jgi:hypothetical protein